MSTLKLEKNVLLAPYTTIRIGGTARFMCFPSDFAELSKAIRWAKEEGLPVFLLGRGANTIFGNYCGLVINTSRLNGMKVFHTGEKVLLEAQCGVRLSQVVKLALELNLEGIYRLAGFPATVGGAVAMNAGAFGTEISHYLKSLLVMDWEGNVGKIRAEDVKFDYRSSPFPDMGIVLMAELRLRRANFDVKSEYSLIRDKRKRTQPINMPTSGSTFKNPPGQYAGKLLEMVGMKGYRVGDVAFSHLHANFLVNLGDGRYEDALKILLEAKRRVYEEFGIYLEEEVKVVESCSTHGGQV